MSENVIEESEIHGNMTFHISSSFPSLPNLPNSTTVAQPISFPSEVGLPPTSDRKDLKTAQKKTQ
jgi:hypothetical protein